VGDGRRMMIINDYCLSCHVTLDAYNISSVQ
jgi:hypothetical protein